MHKEHAYKLGLTMGTLGEHEVAYKLFSLLVKVEVLPEPDLYHYAAVSAWNTGRLLQARRYWKKALVIDQQSGVPRFYLKQLDQYLTHPDRSCPVISYDYQIPKEEIMLSKSAQDLHSDPEFISFLYTVMDEGEDEEKIEALQSLAAINPDDLEKRLREFLLQTIGSIQVKRLALEILQEMKAAPPFTMNYEGYKLQLERPNAQVDFSVWKKKWDQVLECCLSHMEETSDKLKQDVMALWREQLNQGIPPIRKKEGWAAAIEYAVAKHHQESITKTALAHKYKISSSTLTRYIRQLEPVVTKLFYS
jgi:tetratricopeptide (TPR) repeat protein